MDLHERLLRHSLVPEVVQGQIIYHYTTAAGLLGILQTGTLRGTNAGFLNDSSEIAYGLSLAEEVLREEIATRADPAERALADKTLGMLAADPKPFEVYVTSFSARRDVLSQWRGYTSQNGRFCIGFRVDGFSERDAFRLPQRVEYARDAQRKAVHDAVSIACAALHEAVDDSHHAWQCVMALTFHLRRVICGFKHGGFAEEEEWRSIATMSETDEMGALEFEAVAGLPRPFITMLDGSRQSRRLPISEVCIATDSRRNAAMFATALLLRRRGYSDVALTETSIPFVG